MKGTRKKTPIKKKVTTSKAPGNWAPLLRRYEELVVENHKLARFLELARMQVVQTTDTAIERGEELEKAQFSVKTLTETVETLKKEIADLRPQLTAPRKP